jgi:hypothetical protein
MAHAIAATAQSPSAGGGAGYFSANAPQESLPLLVNGTNGGLSACTYVHPDRRPVVWSK